MYRVKRLPTSKRILTPTVDQMSSFATDGTELPRQAVRIASKAPSNLIQDGLSIGDTGVLSSSALYSAVLTSRISHRAAGL